MKKVFFTVMAVCFSAVIFAQGAEKKSLTLEQAKQTALAHNRTLQNASLDIRKAQAQRWQTIASMLPNVTTGYDYQNTMGFTTVFNIPTGQTNPITGEEIVQTIERKNPPQGVFNITVGAHISGQQIVGAVMQNIAVEMADISKKQTELNITSNITTLYILTLANEQFAVLLDSSKNNIDKMYKMTQEAVNVGHAEQTDADKVLVQSMKIESNLNQVKRYLEYLYNSLKIALGYDLNTEIILSETIEDVVNFETALGLLYTDLNLNENFNYQLLQKTKDMSKKQITLAAMGYSPSLTIGYRFSNIKYFGAEPMMNMNPPNAFSIGISMPLFTSGRVFESISEKKIIHQQNINKIIDLEDNLKLQDKQLRFNLNSAYENYIIQKKNIDVTNRVFNNVSQKFHYGKASSLEVTMANTDFISAQNSYIQALMDVVSAQIALINLLNK